VDLLQELGNLGHPALEDEVPVVAFTLGDLAADGGEHDPLDFVEVVGLAEGPGGSRLAGDGSSSRTHVAIPVGRQRTGREKDDSCSKLCPLP